MSMLIERLQDVQNEGVVSIYSSREFAEELASEWNHPIERMDEDWLVLSAPKGMWKPTIKIDDSLNGMTILIRKLNK